LIHPVCDLVLFIARTRSVDMPIEISNLSA
jgi:hypothetical protein